MKVMEIKENTTKKMNSNEYIEAGTYVQVPRYLTIKKSPYLQSIVHPIWLADYTPVIPWPVPSYLMWVLGIPEKTEEANYNLAFISEIEKQELREGQKEVWSSIKEAMVNGEKYRKMIIAPMGTGKTWLICQLCWLFSHPLIVTKPSTFVEVEKQCKKIGVKCPEMTSYESLKNIAWQPDAIFFDECDKIKNVWSDRSQKAMEIGEKASLILAASATPLGARVAKDIQVLNSITGKEIVPSNSFAFDSMFGTKFEEKEHKAGEFHRECLAYDTDRIAEVVSSYVISLGNDEMMNEVLPIRYEKVYCEKPMQYDACKQGNYTKKSKSKRYSQCRMITGGGIYLDGVKYIQMKVNPKLDKLEEIVKQQADGCIIDVYFTEELPIIMDKLKAYNPVAIKSGMSMEKQREVFRKIESGESKVLVKSASLAEGLNLQDAFHVMIRYSIGTSPIKLKQSEGRIYRPGQKKEPIIIDLLCSGTEDERVLSLVQSHVEDTEEMIGKILLETF